MRRQRSAAVSHIESEESEEEEEEEDSVTTQQIPQSTVYMSDTVHFLTTHYVDRKQLQRSVLDGTVQLMQKTVHIDYHYKFGSNGLVGDQKNEHANVPNNKPMLVYCVGCRFYSNSAGVSMGLTIPKFPTPIHYEGNTYVFTVPSNSSCHVPSLVFLAKEDNGLRELFPNLTESDCDRGVTLVETGRVKKRALPVGTEDGKIICPLGYMTKMGYKSRGEPVPIQQSFGQDCITMDEEEYQKLLENMRNRMKDSRILLNPKTDQIKVAPLRQNTSYDGSLILDIFYIDA
jgi:hypothetical protein